MNRFFFPLFVGLFIVLASEQCLGEPAAEGEPAGRTVLEKTIVRFFQSMGGYEDGDLISRSQVQDLQVFLRRTNRRGLVTHPRMLTPVLPDNSRLIRLFYAKNGAQVLREAAKKLGSYRELEELSRSSSGYDLLVKAVNRNNNADEVLEMAFKRREEKQKGDRKVPLKLRVYTIEEFLERLAASAKGKQKSPAEA